MINIFIGVIGIVIAVIGLFFLAEELYGDECLWKVITASFATLLGAVLFFFAFSFKIIPTGHTGVKTTFGQIEEKTLNEGFYLKIPFAQKIETVNNKQIDTVLFKIGNVSAETKTRTEVFYKDIVVTYQVSKDKSAWLYANVTDYEELVTEPLVSSSLKTVSKELEDIDATNRTRMEPLLKEALQMSFNEKYGENTICIGKVVVQSATFSKSYNKAIEEKQKEQLDYEKQQIANKKAVEKAQADADVKIKTAEGESKAAKIKADGEAEANRKLSSSLSNDILTQNFINKWNGELPKVNGNGGDMMFDVTGMLK